VYKHLEIDAAPLGRLVVGLENHQVVFAHLARRQADLERILDGERKRFPTMHLTTENHPVATLLQAYLDGDVVDPVDVPVRWSQGTEFQQRVWQTLRRVRRGQLVTYSGLAAMAGNPRAARAVGGAVSRNPLVLFVPCHRVVAAGGGIGGFSAGLDAKRRWLSLEGVDEACLSGRIHEHSG